MRLIRPHLAIFSVLILAALLGYLGNSAPIGRALGGAFALATDPFILSASLLLGVVRPYRRMLITTVVCSIFVSLLVDFYIRTTWIDSFSLYLVLLRAGVIFVEAHLVNTLFIIVSSNRTPKARDITVD